MHPLHCTDTGGLIDTMNLTNIPICVVLLGRVNWYWEPHQYTNVCGTDENGNLVLGTSPIYQCVLYWWGGLIDTVNLTNIPMCVV